MAQHEKTAKSWRWIVALQTIVLTTEKSRSLVGRPCPSIRPLLTVTVPPGKCDTLRGVRTQATGHQERDRADRRRPQTGPDDSSPGDTGADTSRWRAFYRF